jgi:hypothetical protein
MQRAMPNAGLISPLQGFDHLNNKKYFYRRGKGVFRRVNLRAKPFASEFPKDRKEFASQFSNRVQLLFMI